MYNYIATAHLSNSGGIGIKHIDTDLDTLEYDIISGDKVLETGSVELRHDFDEETEELEYLFTINGVTWNLSEFTRTN